MLRPLLASSVTARALKMRCDINTDDSWNWAGLQSWRESQVLHSSYMDVLALTPSRRPSCYADTHQNTLQGSIVYGRLAVASRRVTFKLKCGPAHSSRACWFLSWTFVSFLASPFASSGRVCQSRNNDFFLIAQRLILPETHHSLPDTQGDIFRFQICHEITNIRWKYRTQKEQSEVERKTEIRRQGLFVLQLMTIINRLDYLIYDSCCSLLLGGKYPDPHYSVDLNNQTMSPQTAKGWKIQLCEFNLEGLTSPYC